MEKAVPADGSAQNSPFASGCQAAQRDKGLTYMGF